MKMIARATPTILLLGLLLGALSAPCHARTYETLKNDNRIIFDSRDYPWRAIGRLNKTTGGFCTATMVANDWVLTAAHCLYNKFTGTYLPAKEIHFVAGYQQDRWVAHSAAKHIVTDKRYDPKDHSNPNNAVNDWALVQLQEPLGHITGTLSVIDHKKLSGQSKQAILVQAGYSRDRAHALTAHAGCRWLGRYKKTKMVLHDCDAFQGDSGSPMLAWTSKGPSIVGIHIGTFRQSKKGLGGAVTAKAILSAKNLPTGLRNSLEPEQATQPQKTIQRILKHLGYAQGDPQSRIKAWAKDHNTQTNSLAPNALIHKLLAQLSQT